MPGRGRAAPGPRREPGARELAHRILLRVELDRAYAGLLLRDLPEGLEPRERALATELVLGTLRWRGRIDHLLGQCADRPLERVDPPLLTALRMAGHQILHLDRIPPPAAVDDAVGRVRRHQGRGAAAFANAVLRRLCGVTPVWPRDADARRAAELSHPEWLVRRWVRRLGAAEAERALAAGNRPAAVTVRPADGKTDPRELGTLLAADGVGTRPGRWVPDVLQVLSGSAAHTAAFRDGRCVIQDEASILVARLLAPRPGDQVADLCAAPGGKATDLAAALGESGRVLASDRNPRRLGLVRDAARRMGLDLRLMVQDAGRPALAAESLDRVLLDAPCSGTGVLRRHPEIRWRRSPEDIPRLAAVQSGLLAAAAELVRPGGALVYSVCSVEPEEGPEVIEAFLRERSDYEIAEPEGVPGELVARGGPGPHLSTAPHRHGVDGFFAVLLRRRRP